MMGFTELSDYPAPTLPDNFPKSLIPKEQCEGDLNVLIKCFISRSINFCPKEVANLKTCVRNRNLVQFDEIKTWEKGQFSKLNTPKQDEYQNNLKLELVRLEDTKSKIPLISFTKNKLWAYSNDIEQISWRIRYLNLQKDKS